ncbi:MAG: tripartite tricarboxylate transporter substrate-binding protein [Burkholderiaceae bacterium]
MATRRRRVDVVAWHGRGDARPATVIVDNKSGAAGRLATEAMLQAPADGTVVVMPGGNVSPTAMCTPTCAKLADLAPTATLCSFDFGLALGPGTPAKTLPAFIAWAKANPGKASYGTPGAGTGMHFMGVMLARRRLRLPACAIPGGAAAMTDLLGGNIPALATTLPNLVRMYKDGKLKIVGFTGDKRLPGLPDADLQGAGLPGHRAVRVSMAFASAKTPAPVLKELEAAFVKAGRQPSVVEALKKLEFEPRVLGSADTLALLNADLKKWGPVVQASGYSIKDEAMAARSGRPQHPAADERSAPGRRLRFRGAPGAHPHLDL